MSPATKSGPGFSEKRKGRSKFAVLAAKEVMPRLLCSRVPPTAGGPHPPETPQQRVPLLAPCDPDLDDH